MGLAGGVGGAAGDVAGQTVGMFAGRQTCFDWRELAWSTSLGAVGGSIGLRPYTAANQPVTSWAPPGTIPDLNPGRWVMTGGATLRNYLGTIGAVGRYPFSNSISATLPGTSLAYPSNLAGNLAGLIGQRVIMGH